MIRIKSKKAQIFTIMAIVLITLLLVSIEVYSQIRQRNEVITRVSTMESFLFSIEKNLERQMFISGYRTIFLAEKQITETGNYIPDINAFFQEAFYNGTVNGLESEILAGATYNYLINDINEKSSKVNVEISFSNPSLELSQNDPWNVKLTLKTNFVTRDKSNLAVWNKQQEIISYIPITEFQDPLYVVNTNALVPNEIRETPYKIFAQGSDVSNLSEHAENMYYLASPLGPSFLDRLEGKTSSNANGIESLVYLPKLSSQGVQIFDKSVVDYIYFSSANPASNRIQGMPDWFKLDNEHLAVYNVTHLTI